MQADLLFIVSVILFQKDSILLKCQFPHHAEFSFNEVFMSNLQFTI